MNCQSISFRYTQFSQPLLYHQSSITNHQSSITNHQSPTIIIIINLFNVA